MEDRPRFADRLFLAFCLIVPADLALEALIQRAT